MVKPRAGVGEATRSPEGGSGVVTAALGEKGAGGALGVALTGVGEVTRKERGEEKDTAGGGGGEVAWIPGVGEAT